MNLKQTQGTKVQVPQRRADDPRTPADNDSVEDSQCCSRRGRWRRPPTLLLRYGGSPWAAAAAASGDRRVDLIKLLRQCAVHVAADPLRLSIAMEICLYKEKLELWTE